MSDDERIARLTDLAQRIWPGAKLVENNGNWRVKHSLKVNHGTAEWVEPLYIGHPMALDGLEAALLVLAGASWRLVPPAWVEQLADEWQDDGDGLRAFSLDPAHAEDAGFARGAAATRIMCAQELRKRATKETR